MACRGMVLIAWVACSTVLLAVRPGHPARLLASWSTWGLSPSHALHWSDSPAAHPPSFSTRGLEGSQPHGPLCSKRSRASGVARTIEPVGVGVNPARSADHHARGLRAASAAESSTRSGPYVLVGHSYGGLIVRRYAALHQGDVAGIILVDPAHEESRLFYTKQDSWLRVREQSEGRAVPPPRILAPATQRCAFTTREGLLG
jgi:hypothetical protein